MIAVIGLVIAAVALVVPFIIESLKRPRLEVVPVRWMAHGTSPFTFASAGVRNKPLPKILGRVLSRDAAQACEVFIDYSKWENPHVRLFESVQGRWDSHPQPERVVAISSDTETPAAADTEKRDAGAPEVRTEFVPSLDPSAQEDIAAGSDRGQVSVAILTAKGEAFGFANESYAHGPLLGNPAWKLPMGTYLIVVRVRASNVNGEYQQAFKLEYLSNDFAKFQLQAITRQHEGYSGVRDVM